MLEEGKAEKCNLQLVKLSDDPQFPGAEIPTSCSEISL